MMNVEELVTDDTKYLFRACTTYIGKKVFNNGGHYVTLVLNTKHEYNKHDVYKMDDEKVILCPNEPCLKVVGESIILYKQKNLNQLLVTEALEKIPTNNKKELPQRIQRAIHAQNKNENTKKKT